MKSEQLRRGLTIFLFLLAATGSEATDPTKTDNDDDMSNRIEEKGKSIDEISSSIEKSTESMEDDIEKAGKGIDSPEAEKRLEIAGNGIDELSDKMDEEIEEKGREAENAINAAVNDKEHSSIEPNNAEKHQSLGQKPLATTFTRPTSFDKQEALRQQMEDAVDLEGQRVEEIGNKMESKRDFIKHAKAKTRSGRAHKTLAWRKKEKLKRRKDMARRKFAAFSKIHKKHITNKKLLNKNATKRRVIVPVKRKKLEKIMLYYYVVEKMKNGELPARNLQKFFEKIDGYSKGPEAREPTQRTEDVSGLLRMMGENARSESDRNPNNEIMTKLGDIIAKLNANSVGRSSQTDDYLGDTKRAKSESFIHLLDQKLRSQDDDRDIDSEIGTPEKANLKSLVNSLFKGGNRGGKSLFDGENSEDKATDGENLTPTSNADDSAELKDMEVEKLTEKTNQQNPQSELTSKQVQKMLQSISEINATLLRHNKEKHKHKAWHKQKKSCEGNNCVGKDIINLLDKALHEVQKGKDAKSESAEAKQGKPEIKMNAETRSQGDPYAGIGFTTSQDGTKNDDSSDLVSQDSKPVSGESRHMEPHGGDGAGASQNPEQRMFHGHHDDDDDDDDEDDDEDDDDHYHDGHTVHGYHFPLPMQQEVHHVHHHMHHPQHEPMEYHGYHGNQLPIRVGGQVDHAHDDYGFSPPLNVDTAPMHHYPDRHMHDHLDVDSMLRGHPYPHHQHTPEVSLEGPISLAPVYEDMHHMLNGPGIHDQPDVHYEVEMHAHPDHPTEGYHGDYGHHDDYDEGHDEGHGEGHHYHHRGFRHEVGYHHNENEGRHDDGYHDGFHGFHGDHGEIHGENSDKKYLISPLHKKSNWKSEKAKHTSEKQTQKKSNQKSKRSTRDDDDDDDDDDDEVEDVPRNGYGVSRLSYLTEQNGNTMEHEIGNRILDVEDVGRSIEENVQHGVDKVTELSNSEVEAPDYDSEGHMEHNIHRGDIQDDHPDFISNIMYPFRF